MIGPSQQRAIHDVAGGRRAAIELWQVFGREPCDPNLLSELLEMACKEQTSDAAEYALLLGLLLHAFSVSHVRHLSTLLDCEWHFKHEDIVSTLDGLRTALSLPALLRAVYIRPKYLDYDSSRTLAVKAIWGIGNIATLESVMLLNILAKDVSSLIATNARKQIERPEVARLQADYRAMTGGMS